MTTKDKIYTIIIASFIILVVIIFSMMYSVIDNQVRIIAAMENIVSAINK